MVGPDRQVPSPSAFAWLIDPTEVGGPTLVVLRLDENQARSAVAKYLVDIGSISNTIQAERTAASAPIQPVGVVW